MNFSAAPSVENYLFSTASGVGIAAGVALTTYGGNYFRTPIDKKMGLQPNHDMDGEAEVAYVINKLNGLKDAQPIDQEELPLHTYQAVDAFLKKNEGYSVETSKRVKHSHFSDLMMWKHGAAGLMNPFFQEIVMFTRLYPEANAHEQAHLKGIPQERLAEFVGIAAQVESGEPYLQNLGYRLWLNRLSWCMEASWGIDKSDKSAVRFEKERKALLERGLDGAVIQELTLKEEALAKIGEDPRSYSKYSQKGVDYVLSKAPEAMRRQIPGRLVDVLRNPEHALTDVMRKAILVATRQGNLKAAYVEKPMQLLSAYRLQAESCK